MHKLFEIPSITLFLCAFYAFLWLKNPQNQRNLRLINDLRSTKDYVRKNKLFMQNKANFRKVKLNVNKVLTKDYEQMDTWSIGKKQSQTKPNKPKTNPIQTQFQKRYLLVKCMIDNCMSAALFPLTSCPAGHYNGFFSKISFLEKIPIERVWK